jgi:hypothetical protein
VSSKKVYQSFSFSAFLGTGTIRLQTQSITSRFRHTCTANTTVRDRRISIFEQNKTKKKERRNQWRALLQQAVKGRLRSLWRFFIRNRWDGGETVVVFLFKWCVARDLQWR